MRKLFYDDKKQQQFESDGYVKVDLLNEEQVAYLRQLEERLSPPMNKNFYTSIWSQDEEYRKGVDKELKDFYVPLLANILIDCKPVFANFMVKKAGEKSKISLHQDWTFVDEDEFHAVNVWCPLVDTSSVNGRLSIVEDSHKLPLPLRGRDIDSPIKKISDSIFEKYATGYDVKAGEAVIYDVRLLHGSANNQSDKKRIATSIVMIPEEAPLIHYVQDKENANQVYKLSVKPEFFSEFSLYDHPVHLFNDKEVLSMEPYSLSEQEFADLYHSSIGRFDSFTSGTEGSYPNGLIRFIKKVVGIT